MGSKRLAVYLVLLACLQQSVSVYCQSGPGITLSETNTPLEKVLIVLRDQYGYTYLGRGYWTQLAKNVTIHVKNADIREVLDICFKDQLLYYKLDGKHITLYETGKTPLFVRGRLVNEKREPIAGVSIAVRGDNSSSTISNDDGEFSIRVTHPDIDLMISSVSYENQQLRLSGPADTVIQLKEKVSELVDVVVANGYQSIPKERATGSFTQVSRSLIERRIATNILDHLDGVTSSLIFNKNIVAGTNQSIITIRGRSTINGNPDPLIVIDNFPYSGDINNINPDDVESITVLKDAAAASIWGAFSGNGVIVITTKKGKYNGAPKLNFTASTTVGGKPDLYYQPILSSGDYIDVEQYLFGKGFYGNAQMAAPTTVFSPVIEALAAEQAGQLSSGAAQARIDSFRMQDTRHDLAHYFYQASVNQQYALNLSGGSAKNKYYLSAGYDKNMANLVRNGYDRVTLNGNNTYKLLPEKLELSTGLSFTASTTDNNSGNIHVTYPYLKLADARGNPLAVPYNLRQSYVDTVGQGRLLDWNFRPLDELRNADNRTTLTDYRINIGIRYTIGEGFEANAYYQYGHGISTRQNYQSLKTYYTRDLINEFTQVDSAGKLSYPVPLGGILDKAVTSYDANNVRLQLNYNHLLGRDSAHSVNIIGGAELRDVEQQLSTSRLYGYDRDRQNGLPVNYTIAYPQYPSPGTLDNIDYSDYNHNTITSDRYLSYYINASYSYLQRYILSASARRDESNLFGVDANKRGVPLWSAGTAWEISKEDFYGLGWLPFLKLRVTDGYNGNVDRAVSAYTTALISGTNNYGAPTANITNPPNPFLRWERINIFNIGVDFAGKDHRVEGSLEYYIKTGKDLIGQSLLDPTTGNTVFTGNTANMQTNGMDISLKTKNITGRFQWNTVLLFSAVRDKVTRYGQKPGPVGNYFYTGALNPLTGRPLYSVYAYKWMGLDATGNPQGWLNGHVSTDYGSITNSTDLSNLLYMGPANPTAFGSLRNEFGWKRWGLSFNIVYKLGYYFRRGSINYYNLFQGTSPGHPDYLRRWQNPGDEQRTYVPSLIYPADVNRDIFYGDSEPLIEKGDHIRLQDIQFTYEMGKKLLHHLPLQSIQFYIYANNIGILWRANHQGIDPDNISDIPNPRTLALGIKLNL